MSRQPLISNFFSSSILSKKDGGELIFAPSERKFAEDKKSYSSATPLPSDTFACLGQDDCFQRGDLNDKEPDHLETLCDQYSDVRHTNSLRVIVDAVEKKYQNQSRHENENIDELTNNDDARITSEEPRHANTKYTPLEQQYLEFSAKYPDALLMVESGYRYRFFGRDAEIASRVLNIRASCSHNFLSTSIPTIRLSVHLRKLVEEGYKVGIVSQTETAALKAIGDNKFGLFSRALTGLFTKSTLLDNSVDPLESTDNSSLSNYLLSIYQTDIDEQTVKISWFAIRAAVGDIVYDTFEDDCTLIKLETALKHLNPIEIILPTKINVIVKNMLETFCNYGLKFGSHSTSIRIQYTDDSYYSNIEAIKSATGMKELKLDDHQLHSLCALQNYLVEFGVESLLDLSCNYHSFQNKTYMKLDGQTLSDLELIESNKNNALFGCTLRMKNQCTSLFSLIDTTATAFGRRLLLEWIRHPLIDSRSICCRLDALDYLLQPPEPNSKICSLIRLLPSLIDLEKGICRIYYRKCAVAEFVQVIENFRKICDSSSSFDDLHDQYPSLLASVLDCIDAAFVQKVQEFIRLINFNAKNQAELISDDSEFEELREAKHGVIEIQNLLHSELLSVRKQLKMPKIEFVTRNRDEYLIELTKSEAKKVPADWITYPGTKTLCRFQTSNMRHLYIKLQQSRELLDSQVARVWKIIMSRFSENYEYFRRVVSCLSVLDCLQSLARLAKSEGYVRPIIQDSSTTKFAEQKLIIIDGRHPVIERLLQSNSQYISNSTEMSRDSHVCTVITGPNMGGKTCYSKQVAVLCILAQIGSYVPASYFEFYPLDAVFTRMGTHDNLFSAQSSFLVELNGTSNILRNATQNSLVIFDELGRGTSTHDGCAIAYAVLLYVVEHVKCWTIFITHYPLIHHVSRIYPKLVKNFYFSFAKSEDNLLSRRMLLLHKLVHGNEKNSYGINVAHMANLPDQVVHRANFVSSNLMFTSNYAKKIKLFQQFLSLNKLGSLDDAEFLNRAKSLSIQIQIAIASYDRLDTQ